MIAEQPRSWREKVRDAVKAAVDEREIGGLEHAVLYGLQFKPTYQGTVDPVTIADRRRRNKTARRSRRINRQAARR